MWSALRHFFAVPPLNSANAEHQAAVLHTVLNAWIAGLLVMMASLPIAPISASQLAAREAVALAVLLSLLACRTLWHRGRVSAELATYIVLTAFWIGLSVSLAMIGSVRAPVASIYVLIVVMAGLLLGRRAAWLVVALCALAIGGLIVAERAQWLPPLNPAVGVTQWVTLAVVMSLTVVLIGLSLRSRDEALAHAQRELGMRLDAEAGLRIANNELEQRVAARTAALRESEARLRALLALSSDWYWELDENHRFAAAGGEALEKAKIDHSNILGKTPWELPHADAGDGDWQRHRAMIEAHQPFSGFEFRRADRDGHMRWVSVSGVPMFDGDGNFRGHRGVGRDIHEDKEKAAVLADAKQRLELALEGSRSTTWEMDATGEVDLSAGWTALLGEAPRERRLTRQELSAFVHPDDIEAVRAAQKRVLKGITRVYEVTHRIRDGNGGWRWLLSRGRVFERAADGRVTRMVGTNTDITELQEAREALRKSEAQLRKLSSAIEQSPASVLITDPQGAIEYVNPEFERVTGYRAAEALGKNPRMLKSGKIPAETYAAMWNAILAGRVWRGEFVNRKKSGELFWEEASISAIRNADGATTHYVAVKTDITARKAAEFALRESEGRFRSLVELSSDWYWEQDENFRFLNLSTRVEARGGFPAASHIGKARWDLPHIGVTGERWAAHRALLDRHQPFRDFEFRRVNALGETIWMSVSGDPVFDETGRFTGYRGVGRNVTERKSAEERLRELNAQLERRVTERTAAINELESFSYSVSHDLRAPVRAVTSFSRMVLENHGGELPAEARQLIERVAKAGVSMGEMINGLLELSRIGRREVVRRNTDLSRLAQKVWSEIVLAAPERKILFEAQEGIAAECDPVLVRNVLQNLLGNAFKYTRDAPEAHVAFGCTERDGERVYRVRDNGAGFDSQYAGKLFGAFQRLHSAAEFEGTGIGLATVRRIVERHGGRIWAEGAPGKGATFYFTLAPGASP